MERGAISVVRPDLHHVAGVHHERTGDWFDVFNGFYISDRENPVEVGYFDTVPLGEDVPGFAGSWSNYPFFESGTIVVTSI